MEEKAKTKFNLFKSVSDTNLLMAITIIVFFLMYGIAVFVLGGSFEKAQSFLDILRLNSPLIIVACGMSLVMISGGIDISVGGVVALVSMTCAVLIGEKNVPMWAAFAIGIGIGLLFGILQGYLVAYLGIQPFIVTLAGMFLARGLTTIIKSDVINVVSDPAHPNKVIDSFVKLKDLKIEIPGLGSVNKHGKYLPATINVGVIIALVVVILMFVFLKWTKKGRHFYAVGGNRQSALMLGINVKRTVFLSHIICSTLAGVAGVAYFIYIGSGSPSHATGMEMNAIASAIIGGTMLTGGVGNIAGTFFGVLSLCTIQRIVNAVGLQDAWWTGITIAAMLCLFLVIQSVIMALKKKALKG